MLLTSTLLVALLYFIAWVYLSINCGKCKSKARMDGKTVIITGCTSGIGKATALDVARRGARVIMACRNLEKAKSVRESIVERSNNKNVVVQLLDVSSLRSVRQFAEEINKEEPRLDVLVHNAGAFLKGKRVTEEGLQKVWATNHFGPFLLTHLLIGLLKRTGKSRIIIVASLLHRFGGVSVKNPNPVEEKSDRKLYCMSKFANVLFANELARRLQGTGVTANSLHPGVIYTPLWETNPLWIIILARFFKYLLKTEEQGAQTTIHLAVSEEVEGVSGRYFSDCREATAAKTAKDPDLASRYWKVCEKVVHLTPSDPCI